MMVSGIQIERLKPNRGVPGAVDEEQAADNDVADDEDHEIGRRVIGSLMEERQIAHRAMVVDLEIGFEHRAFAASRTAAMETRNIDRRTLRFSASSTWL